ncbi:S-layer homology domain-containing protein [Cohnella caldifontis]|uniref:S-layer homology domain-containing protein n=1 Tax=Cohnella caldifontis TaxID=3027471 RepID=UPI0023ED4D8D|nr:S-layer homology domain-containing protein [Cohnella sp. YIM B05605]
MVYGSTDYYLVVSKPGYQTYTSPTISVGSTIVRHDLQLHRTPSSSGGGGGAVIPGPAAAGELDLAVSLFSDRASYGEGDVITFTVQYANRSDAPVKGAVLKAGKPEYTDWAEAAGGEILGSTVKWELGDLAPGAKGKRVYQVKVKNNALTQRETKVRAEAEITASDKLTKLDDDRSSLDLLLFSGRFGFGKHQRYIVGYPDGQFKPNRPVTRAEVAGIFARIMDLRGTVTGSVAYADVPKNMWAAGYIEAVTKAGLFSGYEGNRFKPNQAITRAELSAVIARYLKLSESAEPLEWHFSDIRGHWAARAIEQTYRYHVISGYEDGTFKPNANMIRSEAVTMINRLLNRGPLTGVEATFPDVPKTHWAFGQVEESTLTHEYSRNPDASEKAETIIPEPLW